MHINSDEKLFEDAKGLSSQAQDELAAELSDCQ